MLRVKVANLQWRWASILRKLRYERKKRFL